ncbi:MAG: UDP-glucose 4-epimerase GalE [Methylophilaceae bacterium]|jgi:UDP-glucose 4-epimerase|nr:MAG: UDP-glucose 4-epimerase GalE [Methylophilaceae bacterium]
MILITGAAGYIGSHTCIELLNANVEIVAIDNLCNSKAESLKRVESITGKKIIFYQMDVRDKSALREVFNKHKIEAVIHFAGLKAVGESMAEPLKYYDNNILSTITLCEIMDENKVFNLVFSSSATVYGAPNKMPINETSAVGATTNPYGTSKLMIERILNDIHQSNAKWSIAVLRYFNPVGAHESGLIGEDPNGLPNNLMPFITQVAIGKHDYLNVFGGDYDTADGTGVRDYIHVVDLAIGHLSALDYATKNHGIVTLNLGTGIGYSVLDVIHAFEKASNRKIAYKICPRRPGDIASCYADVNLAKELLNWTARFDIHQMCRDAWRWQFNNPNGYQ